MKILWHNHKCIIWASYLEMTNHHFRRKYAGRFRSVLKAVRLATFPVASRGHFAPQLRSFRVELCSDGKIWRPVAVILAFSKSPTEWLESIWDCIWDEENWMQAFTFRDNQRCWKRKPHYPHSYMGSHVLPKRIHSPNFCQDPTSIFSFVIRVSLVDTGDFDIHQIPPGTQRLFGEHPSHCPKKFENLRIQTLLLPLMVWLMVINSD